MLRLLGLGPGLIWDMIPCGVFAVDADGRILFWNRAAEEITGYSADEMLGRSCTRLRLEGRCGQGCSDGVPGCHVFQEREVHQEECTLQQKDGKPVAVIRSARVISDDTGKPIAAVESFADVSRIHNAEARLESLQQEVRERFAFGRIVGTSPPMRRVYQLIRQVAEMDTTVVIAGESGTGKELVARAIHYNSPRRTAPFVAVNCSAIPDTLVESELFGHVKGAFTGATGDKIGRFEAAQGGTLFLDEVADISPFIQLKLLRVLEQRTYERVGESLPRTADVRVIAASNTDLRDAVDTGGFREDLFYRLRVFPVFLPPLRDRKEDIPLLVDHFRETLSNESGKAIGEITPRAMQLLMDHCWPGNVRELRNAIEHAFVTCNKTSIDVYDLPLEVRQTESRCRICNRLLSEADAPGHRDERAELVVLLQANNWNTAAVGRHLGVSRTAIYKRMKKWGIERPAK